MALDFFMNGVEEFFAITLRLIGFGFAFVVFVFFLIICVCFGFFKEGLNSWSCRS